MLYSAGEKLALGEYGLHGILSEDIFPRTLLYLGQALGQNYKSVLVASDGTKAGGMLARLAASGVCLAGSRALLAHDCVLPWARAALLEQKAACGIFIQTDKEVIVTIMDSDGANLPPEKARDLERILNSGEYKCVPAEEIGELQPFDSAAEIYEKHISFSNTGPGATARP